VKKLAKSNTPVKTEESRIKNWWNNTRGYFSNVYSELKKVHWPGRRQLIAYTGVVLVTVVFMAFLLWLFDSGLSIVLDALFKAFA